MSRVYVGLNLGSSQFEVLAMDREGAVIARRNLRTSELNLCAAFSQLRQEVKGELRVYLEAANWPAGRVK